MKKKNKKLTAKQQKALDRKLRSQYANKPAAVAAAPKRPAMPVEKKWLLGLLALVIVLATVTLTICGVALSRSLSIPKHASLLDTVKLSNYLTVARSNYTGQTASVSYDETYTDEAFEADKKSILFNNRKLLAATQEDVILGVGDTVYMYILGASQNGTPVASGAFAAYSYSDMLSVTIGSDHGFGESLDAALIGLNPKDTVRNTSTSIALTENSVVSLSYEMFVASKYNEATDTYTWKTTAYKSASAARVDMQDLTEAFRLGLIEAVEDGAVGEKVSFILTDYDHDGKDNTAKVAVRIDACVNFIVLNEGSTTITFTPSTDCFANQGYASLCKDLYGKETTFTVILQWADDYEMPEFNAAFIKDVLGFETDKTTDADVIAAYRAKLEESRAEQVKQNKISAIYGQILNSIQNNFTDIPQELYYEEYYKVASELELQFTLHGSSYGDIDTFASVYSYYQIGQQVSSANDYCAMMAEMQAMKELLTYTIFYAEGMKVTDEALREAREKCLSDMIDKAGNPEVYNEEYFIKLYGNETIWQMARREYAIPALVDAFLLANNTVKVPTTSAE